MIESPCHSPFVAPSDPCPPSYRENALTFSQGPQVAHPIKLSVLSSDTPHLFRSRWGWGSWVAFFSVCQSITLKRQICPTPTHIHGRIIRITGVLRFLFKKSYSKGTHNSQAYSLVILKCSQENVTFLHYLSKPRDNTQWLSLRLLCALF